MNAIQEDLYVLDALKEGDFGTALARVQKFVPRTLREERMERGDAPTDIETAERTELRENGTPAEPFEGRVQGASNESDEDEWSLPIEIDYESLSDEPHSYKPPAGIALNWTRRAIVDAGRMVDAFVTKNLGLLFERTVCRGKKPTLLFAEGTTQHQRLSIERAFSPDSPDFVPTLAACCTARVLGGFSELSDRKREFTRLFGGLIDLKVKKLLERFPELRPILSHAAFAICYARYVDHGGKIGMLFTPYLGYVRALNRPEMALSALERGNEIETKLNGFGHILSTFTGVRNYGFFTPISDNPNLFKIPELVLEWFARNVPLEE